MTNQYDAIVVGARVAGAPTAMLLARMGYRVLLVDRARFPSDTMSTHIVHPPGMAALERWGLADEVVASGCPPITGYRFDLGPIAIAGRPQALPNAPVAYAPRRTVLDHILVEAASASGVEVREAFTVEQLIAEDGVVRGIRGHGPDRRASVERARIIIGADGVHSMVARAVNAPGYQEIPPLEALYFAYWSNLPAGGEFRLYDRGNRGFATVATNDGLTIALVAWPAEEFDANRHDLDGNYLAAFDAVPELADAIAAATRQTRVIGAALPSFYRVPFGPGWALVGDAGYHKDPVTAQGITDAFRDAELLTSALDDAWSSRVPMDDALADYQERRYAATMAMYELTAQMASFDGPPPEFEQLLADIAADPIASVAFVSGLAGTIPVSEMLVPTPA